MVDFIGTHYETLVVVFFCLFAAGLASVSLFDTLKR